MATYVIVTAVIRKGDKYLIAKRADTKRFAPGQWEFIAGFMDIKGSAEETILTDLKEELMAEGNIVATAPAFQFDDNEGTWVTIPFLIDLISDSVHIDPNEHSEIRWLSKDELKNYDQLKPFLNDKGFCSMIA